MGIKCIFRGHTLGEPELIAGYDLGLIDRKAMGYKRGSIYCRKCSTCGSPVLNYHPEIDYIALSRTKEKLSPMY